VFPVERFLVACARETLVNEYDAWWIVLDCESLDNHKVRDHIDMSCKPYLLMRCCHDPLMSCQ
jgi:hypothetical protein